MWIKEKFSIENITWSVMGKQTAQAKKVSFFIFIIIFINEHLLQRKRSLISGILKDKLTAMKVGT